MFSILSAKKSNLIFTANFTSKLNVLYVNVALIKAYRRIQYVKRRICGVSFYFECLHRKTVCMYLLPPGGRRQELQHVKVKAGVNADVTAYQHFRRILSKYSDQIDAITNEFNQFIDTATGFNRNMSHSSCLKLIGFFFFKSGNHHMRLLI